MALAGRNDPCPCGSSRKYKRCCGFDRAGERALEDRLDASEALARLAYLSPRLVPESDAYDGWVRSVLAGELELDANDAIRTLGEDEPVRIVSACLELYPEAWEALSSRCGSARDATAALLAGAVAAGIRDYGTPGRLHVETIEEPGPFERDLVEELGLLLDGDQLWSPPEGAAADDAIRAIPDWVDDAVYDERWHAILGDTAARLVTDWHVRRLARLVQRIEAQLPFAGFPRASAVVADGCRAFETDERFRSQLAALLLGDLVGRDALDAVGAAFLAA